MMLNLFVGGSGRVVSVVFLLYAYGWKTREHKPILLKYKTHLTNISTKQDNRHVFIHIRVRKLHNWPKTTIDRIIIA